MDEKTGKELKELRANNAKQYLQEASNHHHMCQWGTAREACRCAMDTYEMIFDSEKEEQDGKFVQFKDCSKIMRHGCEIWLCPRCKDHKQGDCNTVHDCKEIIYDDELSCDGKLQGGNTQCGCYSEDHGSRKSQ